MQFDWRPPDGVLKPLAGTAAALVLAAVAWWWLSAPVQDSSINAAVLRPVPSAMASAVMVDVVGAVKSPGVVRLPAGSRVVDAVAAAGGLLPGREPVLNMARIVQDGEQLRVGRAASMPASAAADGAAARGGRVDLNAASAGQLEALPGIGPVLAGRIVEYRTAHGGFERVRDLLSVPGIGDAKFADLASAVTVS